MAERCEFCGRFMKQRWYQASDEPDSWEDWWSCSRDAQHKIDHPRAYGLASEPDVSEEADRGDA